ncbi:type III-B CRISPR module RAMP protein Cmr6 [Candidatus Chlorohelix sp.]|uniref:type III-B CRISPR module RAMP protein Cmr6 n=1 Tax=Candidatus Chlorohelix sp. TaxID=3139201 RepID=UPI0030689EDA
MSYRPNPPVTEYLVLEKLQDTAKKPPSSANPALVLDKYVGWATNNRGKREVDKNWLKSVFIDHYRSMLGARDGEYKAAYQAYYKRWTTMLSGYNANQRVLKTVWRLAVHLGRTSVIENGTIALQHSLGFPFIPGQSLKGLARAYAEMVALKDNPAELLRLFGDQKSEGSLIFFDAIPDGLPELELDILNPHFPDYYSGKKKLPTDDQNPVPVNFLTVAKNSRFLFGVAATAVAKPGDSEQGIDLLCNALEELGAGAKTAAGYGQFQRTK